MTNVAYDVSVMTPATGASQSETITVKDRPITVSIYPSTGTTITDADSCDLERKNAAGNWTKVYDANGLVTLGSGRTEATIISGGQYRVNKGVTTESIGVAVCIAPRGV